MRVGQNPVVDEVASRTSMFNQIWENEKNGLK